MKKFTTMLLTATIAVAGMNAQEIGRASCRERVFRAV